VTELTLVDNLRKDRDELQAQITALIREFEKRTGLRATNIALQHSGSVENALFNERHARKLVNVPITLEL